ncbi:hypothetical protein [Pseudorhizobium pelagicum]|mgnify:CR=1 FL=1|uniref:hypothetical protein n=1 Tax=Pseudorhizobium pelagicum TaxID=1509405 RepID=UPI0011113894|nr:hypothetical protein [Pseudorhizobium pelagicum]
MVLPSRDATLANRRYRTATGTAKPWPHAFTTPLAISMSAVPFKKAMKACQRYVSDVQRFNSYRDLPMNASTLRLIRRDLGLGDLR